MLRMTQKKMRLIFVVFVIVNSHQLITKNLRRVFTPTDHAKKNLHINRRPDLLSVSKNAESQIRAEKVDT